MKIKAITPLGTFVSVELLPTGPQRKDLHESLTTKIESIEYLNLETEEGLVYFGTDVIRNSVIVVLG
jgi:hypothetical protein